MKTPVLTIDSKLVTVIVLTTLIILSSKMSVAQSLRGSKATKYYYGFQGSFGRHSYKLESNFSEIHRDVVSLDGGQIGVVFGTEVVRLHVGLIGYYSSVSDIGGTLDLYTSNAIARFFPLSALSNKKFRVEPYVSAGASYARSKFFGHYAAADGAKRNYSVVREDYVGTIRQLNAHVGVGFEFKVLETYDFIHLFTDLRYAHDLQATTNREVLATTDLSNHIVMNVGILFGRRK